mgnify:CR=1 FL=1
MQHRSGGLTSDLPAQQAFQLDGFEGVQRPASQRQLDLMGSQGAHPNRLGGPTVDDRAVAQKVQIALTVRLHTAQRAVHRFTLLQFDFAQLKFTSFPCRGSCISNPVLQR